MPRNLVGRGHLRQAINTEGGRDARATGCSIVGGFETRPYGWLY